MTPPTLVTGCESHPWEKHTLGQSDSAAEAVLED